MGEILTLLGVFLAIEGVLYAGFPAAARRMALQISQMDEGHLRMGGLFSLIVGVFLVWLVRG